jgi:hypothetical protein
MYYIVALCNPGRLIGSRAEVVRKAAAYNPDHYQIEHPDDVSSDTPP